MFGQVEGTCLINWRDVFGEVDPGGMFNQLEGVCLVKWRGHV